MDNNEELITVYITTCNRVDLLKRAVDSVIKQTYKNIEIIIVDDCSSDGTKNYLRSLNYKNLKFFEKEKKTGACNSRNIAIENATGKYITGLDDDDYFLPTRIERFYEERQYLDKKSFIFSTGLIKNNNNIFSYKKNILIPKNIGFRDLLIMNFVGNQCFTLTRRLQEAGGFDESLDAWQDLDAWMNLLSKNPRMQAKRITNDTYVQDISHEYGRITTGKKDKVVNSFNHIAQKYNLDNEQKNTLSIQLKGYGIDISENNRFFFKVLYKQKNLLSFMMIFKIIIKNLMR